MNIPAAIAAARRDVEFLEKEWDHDCDCPDDPGFRGAHGKDCPWMRWVNGEDDTRARLADLGGPSVALAEALENWLTLAEDEHAAWCSGEESNFADPCDCGRQALAAWAEAQDGGEHGHD